MIRYDMCGKEMKSFRRLGIIVSAEKWNCFGYHKEDLFTCEQIDVCPDCKRQLFDKLRSAVNATLSSLKMNTPKWKEGGDNGTDSSLSGLQRPTSPKYESHSSKGPDSSRAGDEGCGIYT